MSGFEALQELLTRFFRKNHWRTILSLATTGGEGFKSIAQVLTAEAV
jgi:hypothetical protein